MLKTLVTSSLAVLLLSSAAFAGSDGLSVMWAMRARMDAQIQAQQAQQAPAQTMPAPAQDMPPAK